MSGGKRIRYLNWIVDIGYDPNTIPSTIRDMTDHEPIPPFDLISLQDPEAGDLSDDDLVKENLRMDKDEELKQVVAEALDSLGTEEKEFVVRFHVMGRSYCEIAEKSGREIHKLTALNSRAMKKLRTRLAPFVLARFGVVSEQTSSCRLCDSPYRGEIDRIISKRDPTSTWRPVIADLRKKFNIKIGSPQLLIGHERYHTAGKQKSVNA